jgi:hypothetical protein
MYCRAVVDACSHHKFKALAKASLHYCCNNIKCPIFRERSEGEVVDVSSST